LVALRQSLGLDRGWPGALWDFLAERDWTLLLLVLFVYPLSGIVNRSVYKNGYTLDAYRQIVGVPVYVQVIARTFRTAALVTLLCLALGYPLAYRLATLRPRTARLVMIVVVLPFFTSVIVRTYAWMVLLGRTGLVNQSLTALGLAPGPLPLLYNQAGVLVGMTYVLLPYMVLTLYSVMRGIDGALIRAAYGLGASRLQVFRRIFLPLSLPGVIAGSMLVFIPAVGEFVIPSLLGGPNQLMIGRVLWDEFFGNHDWPVASAVAVAFLLLLVGPIAIYQYYNVRQLEA